MAAERSAAARERGIRSRAVDSFVTLRRYADQFEAEIARGLLEAEGIQASIVTASGMGLLNHGPQAAVLQVRESDLRAADELLRASTADETDPEPGADVVRCPRCELEHCHFGYPRGFGAVPGVAMLMAGWHRVFERKCWRCAKCEHTWDEREEGLFEPSQFAPDDPRPTFQLVRRRAGTGGVLGFFAGWLVVIAARHALAAGALVFLPIAGWLVGRSWKHFVCSDPSCRAELHSADATCPECRKTVAGSIAAAPDHYAEVAAVRREFAALRLREENKKPKRKKRRPPPR
jgi:hypothetical protein